MNDKKILEVRDLTTELRTPRGLLKAVDNISFDVFKGRTLGIVGESGSGKSMTALSITRLVDADKSNIYGRVMLEDTNLLELEDKAMQQVRGARIAMVFQNPMSALNPLFTIGNQIAEVLLLHKHMTPEEAHQEAIKLLDLVGMPDPSKRINEYPHQLSGGQIQRVMIAIALACDPDLLIADEPTTALDVTIQAQILELIRRLQKEKGMGIIFITHDLGVVAQVCDEVAVMYAGQIVEYAKVQELFAKPMHPYTHGLLKSIPSGDSLDKLYSIPGMVPDYFQLPAGCRFQDRCTLATAQCKKPVGLEEKHKGHHVACFHPRHSQSTSKPS